MGVWELLFSQSRLGVLDVAACALAPLAWAVGTTDVLLDLFC